jgi:hypothetical protein
MSVEIKIFDIPEEETEVKIQQKQFEYDETKKLGLIDNYHFDNFAQLDELLKNSSIPITNISTILLKWLLKYLKPIITYDDEFSIPVQSDLPIDVLDKKNNKLTIQSNKQINVVGLTTRYNYVYATNKLNHYKHIDDYILYVTGRYGLLDLETEKFTQERDLFTQPGSINREVMFSSDKQALVEINKLINYVTYIHNYYFSTYGFLYLTTQYKKPENDGKKPSKKIEFDKKGKMTFSHELLEMLNGVQQTKFGKSFYYDPLFMLVNNKILKLYHIGELLGVNNEKFKHIYDEMKSSVEYDKKYQQEIKFAYIYFNKLASMKTIADKKYGIELSKLSDTQLKTVELEYSKISTQEKDNTFYKSLIFSVDANDKKLLERNVKFLENKYGNELKGVSVLDNGVCPHLYWKAKLTLENFGKSNANIIIRDYLTNNYSLPYDINGYFCKVCGEKMASVDLALSIALSGDQYTVTLEDPLQTLIWKEAMFIIATNIKFGEPVPIKPLVNSIASSLRPIIATEEAKIYKNKTANIQGINDILNLYSSIYIFACLVALIVNNPGVMYFSKDTEDRKEKMKNIEAKTENKLKKSREDFVEKLQSKITSPLIENTQEEMVSPLIENVQEFSKDISKDIKENKETKETIKSPLIEGGFGFEDYYGISIEKNINLGSDYDGVEPHHYSPYEGIEGGKKHKKKGGETKRDEVYIYKTGLILLIVTKEVVINKLKNMSIDMVKSIFANAYKWASKYIKPIQVNEEKIEKIKDFSFDQFYNYIYYMKKLSYYNGKTMFPKYTGKEILGKQESEIIDTIKTEDKGLYDNVGIVDKITYYGDWRDDYYYNSYNSIYEYYKKNIYKQFRVPNNILVNEFYDEIKEKNIPLEDKMRVYVKKKLAKPIINIKQKNDFAWKYNNFDPSKIVLSKHFCVTGEFHRVGSFIYSDGKKELELKNSDIKKWLEDNNKEELDKFKNYKIINERCANCSKLIRTDNVVKNNELEALFEKKDNITAFYQYYNNRCPKGNLHEIENNKCGKCGIDLEYNKTSNEEYYNKYISEFKKIEKEKRIVTINSINEIQKMVTTKPTVRKQEEYVYSLKNVSEWSKLLGYSYNILVNIGLSEGYKYVDIEQSKINPSKEKYSYKTRSTKLKAYILWCIRTFNIISRITKISTIPEDIKEFISKQKKESLEKYSQKNLDDFVNIDNKYKFSINDENYCNFLLEHLAGIMLKLADSELVKFLTNKILDREKLLSKPKPFFYKEEITAMESASEDESIMSVEDIDRESLNLSDDEENKDINFDGYDVENADDVWEKD